MHQYLHIRAFVRADGAPPIPAPFARAIIPQLCYFLTRTDRPQLQFEAAWSLTNICAMNAQFTRVRTHRRRSPSIIRVSVCPRLLIQPAIVQDVVQSGAINSFMQILETSPHEDLRGQAVWALANIAGDTIEYRDLLLSMGTVPILLRHLERVRYPLSLAHATSLASLMAGLMA